MVVVAGSVHRTHHALELLRAAPSVHSHSGAGSWSGRGVGAGVGGGGGLRVPGLGCWEGLRPWAPGRSASASTASI